MNGTEMAARLCHARPETKVFLMSGYAPEALTMEPDWQFIQKPFTALEIRERIGSILPRGITSKPANEDHLKTGQWADPGQTHLYPACRPSGNDFSAAEGNGHILNGAELALSHSGAKAINPGSARAEPSH
jgi:hypothetical protein